MTAVLQLKQGKKKKHGKKHKTICRKKKLKKTFVVEIREGLYLLKPGSGQDNKVKELLNIKIDPGIFMSPGRTAGMELVVWLQDPPWHEQGKRQNSR